MKLSSVLFLLLLLYSNDTGRNSIMAAKPTPVDQHATVRTNQLFRLLHTVSRDRHKVLFGQQDATWSGVRGGHAPYSLTRHDGKLEAWQYTTSMGKASHPDELCDVCALVNDFPAVVGFDLNKLEKNMTDALTFLVKRASSRGAVVTVSWHHRNPVTNGRCYIQDDHHIVLHTVKRLLPGGDHHYRFLSDLDAVASWAKSLRDSQGEAIPIIFRPFHEASGSWFWWGLGNAAHNTADDIVRLYQMTVDYLTNTQHVHHFLYAFSPSCKYDWQSNALYPGDDYVDIIGLDCYQSPSNDLVAMQTAVEGAVSKAELAGKVAAWTEFGSADGLGSSGSHFYSQSVLRTMTGSQHMTGVAYMLTWTNRCIPQGTCTIFAPDPSHPLANDFLAFYNNSHVMFVSDLHRYAPYYSH